MTSSPMHPVRWWRAALLLAAVALLSPGRATAGCGDHVRILPAGADPVALPGDPSDAPAVPCHGPGCQSAPDRPPAEVPVTAPTVGPPDAALSAPDSTEPPAAARWPVGLADSPSRPVSDPVFHPPRG